MKFISPEGLYALLDRLGATNGDAYEVFVPRRRRDRDHLSPWSAAGDAPTFAWNDYRLPESLKALYFPTGREITRWDGDTPVPAPPLPRRAIVGAKACDLAALRILDRVFRDHVYPEPTWCRARDENLLISGDCTDCAASCFCTMMGGAPHPTEGFDLNLAPVEGGYLVEVGSDKGEQVVARHDALFREAAPDLVAARDADREAMTQRVRTQNRRWPTKDPFEVSVDKNSRTRIWGRLAASCVECNACNMACPTCHCFLLVTVPTQSGSSRFSVWDSCFQSGHGRMAGGGTPRLQLTERFRNHYLHKFVVFPRNWGVTACSGCGRCIDACMGGIDKRECLHRLETEWIPSEVLPEVE